MVYNWKVHEQTCRRMYIDERKSLEEIMEFMRVQHKFTPSKRAFQNQFHHWQFPPKRNPALKDARLVARVKELWERNLTQREILRVLNEEDGFEINHRELMRVRNKNRWLLREPNPGKSPADRDSSSEPEGAEASQLSSRTQDPQDSEDEPESEVLAKRQNRLRQLAAESAERLATRKRRRWTRGHAGLPADPPGPPRFPSETTLEESRTILNLDTELYRELRNKFAQICGDAGISKKTIAGPDRWDSAKDNLIRVFPHLQTVMWMSKDNPDEKKLALDVICTDVTKRLRTMEQKMTLSEAKNALGVNPDECRLIRHDFNTVLRMDHCRSKLEAGQEHWDELKTKWITMSPILQARLAAGTSDPMYGEKLRALEVIARDVMKRVRDDGTKKDPSRTGATSQTSSSSQRAPRRPVRDSEDTVTYDYSTFRVVDSEETAGFSQNHDQQQPVASTHLPPAVVPRPSSNRSTRQTQRQRDSGTSHNQAHILVQDVTGNDLPIDPSIGNPLPSLLNTGKNLQPHNASYFMGQTGLPHGHAYTAGDHFETQSSRATHDAPIAVYIRAHPTSTVNMNPSFWIATLNTRTFDELRRVVLKDTQSVMCGRILGCIGEHLTIEITKDEELGAFLAVAEGSNGAVPNGPPTFSVQFLWT